MSGFFHKSLYATTNSLFMFANSTDLKKRPALLEFAYVGKVDDFLQNLAEIAMPEKWNYTNSEDTRPYPILFSYLNHTYMRLKEQGKVLKQDIYHCFNTGLVTDHQQEIFAIFKEVERGIVFHKFCTEGDNSMGYYSPLPERATYFTLLN